MRVLPFYVVFTLPVAFALSVQWGGWWAWLTPAVIFALIPVGDMLLGHETSDPAEGAIHDPWHDLPLRLWLPAQLMVLGLGLWRITQGVTPIEAVGYAVSVGLISGGGGINVAHELMHRKSKLDQGLAEVLMTLTSYSWFCVEHILGHHRMVATATDPATSRYGESLWAFVPRSILGGLVSAWRLEGDRCERKGIPRLSLRNRQLRHALWLALAYALVTMLAGLPGVVFFAAQSLVAVVALETINYVEHYGLERELEPSGRHERVKPHHSWNSTTRVTNWFTFNLQRHADHHAYASRPYDQLRAWTDAPQLPLGYSCMMMLATIPPLWFWVMNPRVRAVREAVAQRAKSA